MPVITISRGSYSRGKEIAEKVARKLGYECIARDVLLEASKEFNVPEIKLVHAVQNAPSFFDKFSYTKERYITFIEAAILTHLQKDNYVYHGFAGHFFLRYVPHVIKVRVNADLEDRVNIVMERDNVSREEAHFFIERIDEARRRWSEYLYGIDTRDSRLYDLVIHVGKITVEDAVDMVCDTARLERFQTTPESQKAVDDLAIAARVKAAVMAVKPDLQVCAEDGVVFVRARASLFQHRALTDEILKVSNEIPGVKETRFHVFPSDGGLR
jgi:cytidylate kinase